MPKRGAPPRWTRVTYDEGTPRERIIQRNSKIFRVAWERAKGGLDSHRTFAENLVGVQITAGASKQPIVSLPMDGRLYSCGAHVFKGPYKVFRYGGKYMCPQCGRTLTKLGVQ